MKCVNLRYFHVFISKKTYLIQFIQKLYIDKILRNTFNKTKFIVFSKCFEFDALLKTPYPPTMVIIAVIFVIIIQLRDQVHDEARQYCLSVIKAVIVSYEMYIWLANLSTRLPRRRIADEKDQNRK